MEAQQELTPDDVTEYFERYGWAYERVDELTFRTGFQGQHGVFAVLVRVTEHWVVFSINPFVEAKPNGFGPTLLYALSLANHAINLAKIGIDQDGDAFLTIELPTEGFAFSHFADALGAISHFADDLMVPMLQASAIDDWNTHS